MLINGEIITPISKNEKSHLRKYSGNFQHEMINGSKGFVPAKYTPAKPHHKFDTKPTKILFLLEKMPKIF